MDSVSGASRPLFSEYGRLQVIVVSRMFSIFAILWLLSLIGFALLRLFTGISIKRLGYFSLKNISLTPRQGMEIRIETMGIRVHRPTVASPGWVSFHLDNVEYQLSTEAIKTIMKKDKGKEDKQGIKSYMDDPEWVENVRKCGLPFIPTHNRFVRTAVKWILPRLGVFDIAFNSISVHLERAIFVCTGSSILLDARNARNLLNATFVGTLDTHKLAKDEMRFNANLQLADLYLADGLEDENPTQILKQFTTNFAGVLSMSDFLVKDIAFEIGFGRVSVPLGRLQTLIEQFGSSLDQSSEEESDPVEQNPEDFATMGYLILSLVYRVEIKVNSAEVLGIPVGPAKLALSMKDLKLDLSRMNPQSPGFKLSYSDTDVAHQAILTGTSINFGADYGEYQEELLYIPLITALTRGDIFSKTLLFVQDTTRKNEGTIQTQIAIHNPTFNVEMHQLMFLQKIIEFLGSEKRHSKSKRPVRSSKWTLPLQFLPRTRTSIIITDVAARLVLGSEKIRKDTMFIASCSHMQVLLLSTHAEGAYSIDGSLEFTDFLLWYRSEVIERVDIIKSSEIGVKVAATTHPKLSVTFNSTVGRFRLTLIQHEIFCVLRELGLFLHPINIEEGKDFSKESVRSVGTLRKLPKWITAASFSATDTCFVVASDQFRSRNRDMLGIKLMLHKFDAKLSNSHSEALLTLKATESLVMKFNNLLVEERNDPTVESMAEILNCPSWKIRIKTTEVQDRPVTKIGLEVPEIAANFNISLLLAAMVINEVLNLALARDLRPQPTKHSTETMQNKTETNNDFGESYVLEEASLKNMRLKVDLPSYDQVMLEFCDCTISRGLDQSPAISARSCRMYSQSPYDRSAWVLVLSLSRPSLIVHFGLEPGQDRAALEVGSIRINIPFNFKIYRIFDHGITLAKAARTLICQTQMGKWDYILEPSPIPKLPVFPQVHIKTRLLLLSLENDFFEAELKLGLETMEIASRNMDYKLKLFERKVKELLKHEIDSMLNYGREREREREQSPNRRNRTSSETTRVKHAVTIAASAVRDVAQRKSSSKKWHANLGSQEKDSSLEFMQKLMELPMELTTSPDEIVQENHPWVGFWSSQRYSKLRDSLKIANDETSTENDDATPIVEMRERLLQHFSRYWKYSIDGAKEEQSQEVSQKFPEEPLSALTCEKETIMDYSSKPLLLAAQFRDLDLLVRRSDRIDTGDAHEWLYNIGKGLPKDISFSIWIPMHLDLRAKGGVRVDLLDYPLPVLHFPELSKSQDPNTNVAFQLKGELMITEQLVRHPSNIRRLFVPLKLLAPELRHKSSVDVLEVHRTLAPMKTYTQLEVKVDSENPTRVTWCSSYRAAFHSVGLGFSSFTKPPIDRSPGLGFWDKIRLVFHARLNFSLPKSPLFLMLKGGKNPHHLLRTSAGFAFVWRNNVNVAINQNDLAKDLFVVDSEKFETVVPDFMKWENDYLHRSPSGRAKTFKTDYVAMNKPEKTIFRFGNNIQWKLGVICEQTRSKLQRSTITRPHWKVRLNMPEFVKDIKTYDAYHGFRTDVLFLAISVSSLRNTGKNSAHLSPSAFSHFNAWKSQFGGSDPPLRTGSLYPSVRAANHISFGYALKGVQYQMRLSPLSIAFFRGLHNTGSGHDRHTGLKMRVDKFVFDLHQRREPSATSGRWKMHLHLGEIDVQNVDLRVVDVKKNVQPLNAQLRNLRATQSSSTLSDADSGYESSWQTSSRQKTYGEEDVDSASYAPRHTNVDEWIDEDDYTELGESHDDEEKKPSVRVHPLMYAPRMSYFRKTDLSDRITATDSANQPYLKFDEALHDCFLSSHHPENIQAHLLATRQSELADRLTDLRMSLDSLQISPQTPAVTQHKTKLSELITIGESSYDVLSREILKCHEMFEKDHQKCVEHKEHAQEIDKKVLGESELFQKGFECERLESEPFGPIEYVSTRDDVDTLDTARRRSRERVGLEDLKDSPETATEDDSHYVNRVIVHAVSLKWNNQIRDLLYRLRLSIEAAKELRHDLSQTVISYLDSLVKRAAKSSVDDQTLSDGESSSNDDLENLLDIRETHCNLDEIFKDLERSRHTDEVIEKSVSVQFITPRIQLVSEKNKDHCVLVSSRDIELRIVSASSASLYPTEDASAEIEKRYGVNMRDTSVISLSHDDINDTGVASLCLEPYGLDKSEIENMWPPWLVIEICYHSEMMANFEIMRQTRLGLRCVIPNSLHVMQSYEIPSDSRLTRVEIEAPELEFTSDSVQFFTVYTIAMDLLVYKDPVVEDLEKALERIILTTDYNSGFDSSLEHIKKLQSDLRITKFLQEKFVMYSRTKEPIGGPANFHPTLLRLEREYRRGTLRLMLLIRAFRAGLRSSLDKKQTTTMRFLSVLVKKLYLYALNDKGSPFLRLQLSGPQFSQIKIGDEYSVNRALIPDLYAQNMLPNAIYPDMLERYKKSSNTSNCLVRVQWTNMDPVGGIPIVDDVQIQVQPIHLQLERRIVDKLMDFAFPIKNAKDDLTVTRTTTDVYKDVNSLSDSSIDSESTSKSSKTEKDRSIWPKNVHEFPRIWKGIRKGDHVGEMVNRASNCMNIVSIRIFASELYLSYKGRSSHNLMDLQDIEIPLHEIVWTNKMWTRLDLILHVKREVIKILLGRSGSILGNKFIRHKPEPRPIHHATTVEDQEGLLVPRHRQKDTSSSDHKEADDEKRTSSFFRNIRGS